MNRNQFLIVKEILKFCAVPQKFTWIMGKCNLSYSQVNRYLELCIDKGWLIHTDEGYLITDEGIDVLDMLNHVAEVFG